MDVENVEAIAKELIESLMRNWPDEKAPPPCRLVLYVRADSTELWDAWATHEFRGISVVVRGVQHYVKTGSKNSSDIAIAIDAMADLLLGRISHIAVLSDDTDFMSLYAAIKRECGQSNSKDDIPFLWLVTDRSGTKSATVLDFFPDSLMHVVRLSDDNRSEAANETEAEVNSSKASNVYAEIAGAIHQEFTPGTYGSTAFQALIQERWPKHPMAKSNGAAYGTEFKNNVWPILEKAGATMASQKPNKYQLP
ncbi:MAG: NYN domain-containing protein [Chloroflexi bacterium]|nr:NYN domain-containing protein [Chloroflexota bacterium]